MDKEAVKHNTLIDKLCYVISGHARPHFLFSTIEIEENSFSHIGTETSGRYPRGSGLHPYQHESWFRGFGEGGTRTINEYVKDLRDQGLGLNDIAIGAGFKNVNELRKAIASSNAHVKDYYRKEAARLRDEGKGNSEIARLLSDSIYTVGESTVRSWLDQAAKEDVKGLLPTADTLRKCVAEKGIIDVGDGVAGYMGITKDRLNKAVKMLVDEGYQFMTPQVQQVGGGPMQKTTISVLAPPGMTYKEMWGQLNEGKLGSVTDYTTDGGNTFAPPPPVKSISSDRIAINYDSGKDGNIEIRRGVADLSLGDAMYAQVRIGVDGDHYLKGMATYADDLPDGVDIRFNTSKSPSVAKMDVLKPMKKDPLTGEVDQEDPFGTTIKGEKELKRVGRYYTDEDGNQQVSPINVVNEPGDWQDWHSTLPTQYLAKQDLTEVKKQLNLTLANKENELAEIQKLDNPVVKQKLLNEFAEDCDTAAVHLKAMSYPGQQTHVLIPIESGDPTHCYAPNYENGTKLALVRFPHGGPSEIPIVTVDNNNEEAKNKLGTAPPDALGLHVSQYPKLSGADSDGDTVQAIPIGKGVSVRTEETLRGLENFEPKTAYKGTDENGDPLPGVKMMTNTGMEMGKITNLMSDMYNKIDARATAEKRGWNDEEIDDYAAATRHSMVVVDAEKHKLDYQRSEKDNRIDELKAKYRGDSGESVNAPASLFSRAKNEVRIDGIRTRDWKDDTETGEKQFKVKTQTVTDEHGNKQQVPLTQKTYTDKEGKEHKIKLSTKSTQMAEAKDAYDLMSGPVDPATGRKTGTPKEKAYADYANSLKKMANDARKEALNTKMYERNPDAAKAYAAEVASLKAKAAKVEANRPKERMAQVVAREMVNAKKGRYDGLSSNDKDEQIEKLERRALATARDRFGAQREPVTFTDKEWEAVQAHAISPSMLKTILTRADTTDVKQRATPRAEVHLSDAQKSRIYSLASDGATPGQIAASMSGVSASMISKLING